MVPGRVATRICFTGSKCDKCDKCDAVIEAEDKDTLMKTRAPGRLASVHRRSRHDTGLSQWGPGTRPSPG
ncbi:hypothetical protein B1H18_23580 [Streptomyces tsukubensis]|uniref:Uncharacterized protein n=1 Tax=Streptomyces tsukubensis TaxID=83656 RepID=A0A1V4A3P9_9ACTN|nr:hypothetical protein B1H18_23580 [Streptomyces tsukubensis]